MDDNNFSKIMEGGFMQSASKNKWEARIKARPMA